MTDRPAWKDDFPIAWVDDHFVTRREFTRSLAWASCASFGVTAGLGALGTPAPLTGVASPRRVARVDDLPVGGSRVFSFPDATTPCLLVRRDTQTFVAFTQGCTHLGCPVVYQRAEDRLECPCHAGFFSAEDGRVLSGPPPRPLTRIALERRGGELWAVGVRS
jgi:nitrite reductase/ring-hydroxylating ferredoxin subunit